MNRRPAAYKAAALPLSYGGDVGIVRQFAELPGSKLIVNTRVVKRSEMPWNFTASATWRYIGPVSNDNNSPDPFLHFATFGGYDYFNPRIPSYGYLDLSATWYAGKVLTIRAGVNNVLDKDPPLLNTVLVPAGQANTNDVYDMFGRQIFVAFTAKF